MPYITPELRLCSMVCFTTKRNYTTLKPQIHGAKSTVLLPNRVISVDIYQQKLHKSESTINAFSHSRRSGATCSTDSIAYFFKKVKL